MIAATRFELERGFVDFLIKPNPDAAFRRRRQLTLVEIDRDLHLRQIDVSRELNVLELVFCSGVPKILVIETLVGADISEVQPFRRRAAAGAALILSGVLVVEMKPWNPRPHPSQ